jgi:zinc transport system substrate-binding protein
MSRRLISIIITALLVLSSISCAQTDTSEKPVVAVGIVPQAAFVDKVADGLVDVVTLIPPGNSPANYQPTTREMQALSEAVVYFTLRMPTEEANILPKAGGFNKNLKIVDLHQTVEEAYPMLYGEGHYHDDGHGDERHEDIKADPHIWLSPKRAVVMVENIAEELSFLDPVNKQTYQENAESFIGGLRALDDELSSLFSDAEKRKFIIYHGSYAYFADDYGLEMTSIEIGGKHATATEIRHVIESARENDIKTVFYQDEFDDSQARTVAQEIGGVVAKASPLSYDYISSLREFAYAIAEGGE